MHKDDNRIIKKTSTIKEEPLQMPVINTDNYSGLEQLSGKVCDGNHGNKYNHESLQHVTNHNEHLHHHECQKEHDDTCVIVHKDDTIIPQLFKRIEQLNKYIYKLDARLTDAESDINKLRGNVKPESITNAIVEKSNSFTVNKETGNLEIKTNGGVTTNDNGEIVMNHDESLVVKDNGRVGVDYDGSTLGLIDGQLSTVSPEWDYNN